MRYLSLIVALLMLPAPEADAQRRARRRASRRRRRPKVEPAQFKCPEPLGTRREDRRRVLLRPRRTRSGRRCARSDSSAHRDRVADLRPPQSAHLFGRGYPRRSRLREIHRGGGGADDEGGAAGSRCGADGIPIGAAICTSASPAAPVPAASKPSRRSAARRSRITIPAAVNEVSILGEMLDATTAAGHETATPGRTVAVISNVRVEYRPAPVKPATGQALTINRQSSNQRQSAIGEISNQQSQSAIPPAPLVARDDHLHFEQFDQRAAALHQAVAFEQRLLLDRLRDRDTARAR